MWNPTVKQCTINVYLLLIKNVLSCLIFPICCCPCVFNMVWEQANSYPAPVWATISVWHFFACHSGCCSWYVGCIDWIMLDVVNLVENIESLDTAFISVSCIEFCMLVFEALHKIKRWNNELQDLFL